ncbi:MAG: DUF1800 domain-containing protein [Gemmatimonadetes bacterium]|nr:DUF1800 domain-containing protein [Gemmatimonadota bacterium]
MSISSEESKPVAPDEHAEFRAPDEPPDASAHDAEPADLKATRRQLFRLGGALAAATLLTARNASAQRVVRPHTTRPKSPPAPGDSLVRLVRRITNGVTEEELSRARSMGFKRYLEYHLNPAAIDDHEVETFVSTNYPALTLDGLGLYQLDRKILENQLVEATLYRAAFSQRQLYERMVHFWSDHFTIYYPKVQYLKVIDDREVIRKHALGKFPDMLRASAHSPAMLEYLDNTRSRGRNVNQNYARELMELHTLGVDGGYTQTDVEEVTRCLTGWTIQGRGNFRFDPAGHDFTAKTVLGTAIPAMSPSAGEQGIQDGETVLNILLAHPSTAKFISTKMIRWLLQYDPPAALVEKVAATFTRTGGDIPSMIRNIMTPANLLAAPAKYRQPYQLVLAALRATQPKVTRIAGIATRQLSVLGQPLFYWEDPDGYPDNVDWWAGLILQRWNFASYLTSLTAGDVVVDVTPLMKVNTAAGITEAINQRAFGGEMPASLKQHVSAHLTAVPITTTRVREAFALALSSTSFQWF